MNTMDAIDLFAGLGGFSEGARAAGCRVRWAGNHWPEAVRWHGLNHPDTAHACQDLEQADWTAVPAHDLLLASPACQGHSPARGKERPHHDALRSTAWAVVAAAECHRPGAFVVENVPAFHKWLLFPAWCSAMHTLGYAISPYVLDAADHGVPQNRKRLFLVGTRSQYPVQLDLPQRSHVPASSFIDFDAGKWSAVAKPGRATSTLERVANARREYGSRFVMPYYGSGSGKTGRALSRPIGTITTCDRWAIVDGERMRMLSKNENRAAMGFGSHYLLPDDHKQAVHMLGNAVPPAMAKDVIEALQRAV